MLAQAIRHGPEVTVSPAALQITVNQRQRFIGASHKLASSRHSATSMATRHRPVWILTAAPSARKRRQIDGQQAPPRLRRRVHKAQIAGLTSRLTDRSDTAPRGNLNAARRRRRRTAGGSRDGRVKSMPELVPARHRLVCGRLRCRGTGRRESHQLPMALAFAAALLFSAARDGWA